jgi:hypothetical protein
MFTDIVNSTSLIDAIAVVIQRTLAEHREAHGFSPP